MLHWNMGARGVAHSAIRAVGCRDFQPYHVVSRNVASRGTGIGKE